MASPAGHRAPEAPAIARPKRRLRFTELTTVEFAMRFAVWASQLHSFPTPDQVRDRFGVSRATAYRYRSYWGEAIGVTPPKIEAPAPQIRLHKVRVRNP